ncbi:MAG: class I SAM-dependent methyltransferase [Nitrospirota bacterium]
MQNTIKYEDNVNQLDEVAKQSFLIKDPSEKYIHFLDSAIEEFNARLEYIDRRSTDQTASQDELLIVTTKTMMDMCKATEELEQSVGYDKTVLKPIRENFREKTKKYFEKSFCNRARIWPQGYPGDYYMIEFVYRNAAMSSGIGFYLDRYFLGTTLSVAVRERKELLRELVRLELNKRNKPISTKILDVACGSCREVFELTSDIVESGANITCLDFDGDALEFAANRFSSAGLLSDNISFRKYNAIKMINHERNLKEFGMQDVIYSVGFFDYLDDDILIRLLSSLYKLTNPGGSLIMSFKDRRKYKTFDNSWLLNWDAFFLRTEEDMLNILEKAGIETSTLTSTREKSGVVVFFIAEK